VPKRFCSPAGGGPLLDVERAIAVAPTARTVAIVAEQHRRWWQPAPANLPAGNIVVQPRPTVSLVLGSGGARGLAHIGIIEAIEQAGYEVCSMAGTSMGALVGGIYAAGRRARERIEIGRARACEALERLPKRAPGSTSANLELPG
jgi:Patatin-like phospholipase